MNSHQCTECRGRVSTEAGNYPMVSGPVLWSFFFVHILPFHLHHEHVGRVWR